MEMYIGYDLSLAKLLGSRIFLLPFDVAAKIESALKLLRLISNQICAILKSEKIKFFKKIRIESTFNEGMITELVLILQLNSILSD